MPGVRVRHPIRPCDRTIRQAKGGDPREGICCRGFVCAADECDATAAVSCLYFGAGSESVAILPSCLLVFCYVFSLWLCRSFCWESGQGGVSRGLMCFFSTRFPGDMFMGQRSEGGTADENGGRRSFAFAFYMCCVVPCHQPAACSSLPFTHVVFI